MVNFFGFAIFEVKMILAEYMETGDMFINRSYPNHLLDTAFQKATTVCHSRSLSEPSANISTIKVPLVLSFHPFNFKVSDLIFQNFEIVKNNPSTQ